MTVFVASLGSASSVSSALAPFPDQSLGPKLDPQTIRTSNLSLKEIARICHETTRLYTGMGLVNAQVRVVNKDEATGKKTKVFIVGSKVFGVGSKPINPLYGTFKEERLVTGYNLLPTGELERDLASYIVMKNKKGANPAALKTEFEILQSYSSVPEVLNVLACFTHKEKRNGVETGRIRTSLVMPRFHQNLSDVIKLNTLQLPQKIAIIRQLVNGVVAMHSRGDVHRDLKLSNVLVGADQRVVIADLGSCLQSGTETVELKLEGSPLNLSPECARCVFQIERLEQSMYSSSLAAERQKLWRETIRPSNDIWALGIMIYELLEKENLIGFPAGAGKDENLRRILWPYRKNAVSREVFTHLYSLTKKETLFEEPADTNSWAHLLWEMLKPNPAQRITARDVLIKIRHITGEEFSDLSFPHSDQGSSFQLSSPNSNLVRSPLPGFVNRMRTISTQVTGAFLGVSNGTASSAEPSPVPASSDESRPSTTTCRDP